MKITNRRERGRRGMRNRRGGVAQSEGREVGGWEMTEEGIRREGLKLKLRTDGEERRWRKGEKDEIIMNKRAWEWEDEGRVKKSRQ